MGNKKHFGDFFGHRIKILQYHSVPTAGNDVSKNSVNISYTPSVFSVISLIRDCKVTELTEAFFALFT